ncbi:MAG: hypothetical protein JSW47_05240, partial [Phycisphaerales bacterium]
KLSTVMRSLEHSKIFLYKRLYHAPFHNIRRGPSTIHNIVIPVKTVIQQDAHSLDSSLRGKDRERG